MQKLIAVFALVVSWLVVRSEPEVTTGVEGDIYFGLLHAHTLYSDGSGRPQDAFAMAKEAGLDFFAVTPHNHKGAEGNRQKNLQGEGGGPLKDGVLIGLQPELYTSTQEVTANRKWKSNFQIRTETVTGKSVIQAAADATSDDFVAIYGQEFSTISSGNHVNVFNIGEVLTVPNGNYRALFDLLDERASDPANDIVVQLNHPGVFNDLFYKGKKSSVRKKMYNDYGIDSGDLGPRFADLVARADPHVHLIEMLSGPALRSRRPQGWEYTPHEDDYYFYLVQGLHVSPTAGQDNHYRTWGKITDARTGVHADELSLSSLLAAFRANRTYASEDKDLKIRFELNGEHRMGANANLEAGARLDFAVRLEDPSEPQARYSVTLFYGDVLPGHRDDVPHWVSADGLEATRTRQGDGTVVFAEYAASGKPEFFYVRVRQSYRDRAWTAPIWINHPRDYAAAASATAYVWSKRPGAEVYHLRDCKWAQRISAANRATGATPPDGRRPARCVEEAEDDH